MSVSLLNNLKRSDVWTTADRRVIPIEEVNPDHAWNILKLLTRNAKRLHAAACFELALLSTLEVSDSVGEALQDELLRLEDRDPYDWLEGHDIWPLLVERANAPR